ncbi:hypothetical protein AWH48_15720 [Domibacillus aminovorans]|uniref:Uncharacterized protein n=1 Tax=Domibacillus aminovorans TaxID=29332 RepID=A0A177L0P2_9BACI|nr:hypothetical protein AWH48_15720 [Domibacillus aminovorans]
MISSSAKLCIREGDIINLDKKHQMNVLTRLRQLFCDHKDYSKVAFSKGLNRKEGYELVVYECLECRHCYTQWDKEEDW